MSKWLYVSEDNTIKFEHEGSRYCVHIHHDECPCDPREWGGWTIMALWHSRYNLGDNLYGKSPKEFWNDLVNKYSSEEEFVKYLMADDLVDSHVEPSAGQENILYAQSKLYDFWDEDFSKTEPIGKGIPYSDLYKWMDDLSIRDCMRLLEHYCEWKPVYMYDHGGISISTGNKYPYNDRWDGGQIGWCVLPRREFEEAWKDDPCWKARADDIIDDDVEIYSCYLEGDVWGFTLYEWQQGDGEMEWVELETDGCWGYFGGNIMENGMADEIAGLKKAILCDEYTFGKAHKVTRSYYEI